MFRRVHQRYNAVLREAESLQHAVECEDHPAEDRERWKAELWRLGATSILTIRRWQKLAGLLKDDLAALRREVEAYLERLRERAFE